MEREEEILLKSLDWKGKGLIRSAFDAETNSNFHQDSADGNCIFYQYASAILCLHIFFIFGYASFPLIQVTATCIKCIWGNNLIDELSKDRKKEGSLRFYKPKFRYIFCDMDGKIAVKHTLQILLGFFIQILIDSCIIQRNIAEQQKSNFFYNCQCFERGVIQGCENCDSYWKSKINISIVCQGLMLIWIIYSISDNTYQSLVSATAMYLDLFSHINIDIHTVENMF